MVEQCDDLDHIRLVQRSIPELIGVGRQVRASGSAMYQGGEMWEDFEPARCRDEVVDEAGHFSRCFRCIPSHGTIEVALRVGVEADCVGHALRLERTRCSKSSSETESSGSLSASVMR